MDCVAEGSFGTTLPNGCHVAEVEIDPETGVIDVVNYATVDDIGNVVDHTSVEGQVHGGVLQGVGQVLGEHAIYDSGTGQLLSGSFMDYPMPHADLMRAIRCDEHPVPTKANALGSKGVGESGTSGALGATMNAILNAVRSEGITDFDMPVTPTGCGGHCERHAKDQPSVGVHRPQKAVRCSERLELDRISDRLDSSQRAAVVGFAARRA